MREEGKKIYLVHVLCELNIALKRMVVRLAEKGVTMDVIEDCTDEEYLIMRSKMALEQGNVSEAKTWMLTARSIFPQNFSIQFEAYVSEKKAGNVKECAKCFQVNKRKLSY